ncbi:MAG: phosphoribosylformylglycinamidine synthase subunit PurL [Armatimonadota bacterium]|nr:phosphoribosylformylglycinamidine synthase subunit PurL [Armatimonadota bacterium]MDR7520058.1 phosphoribosylformylglycinamidine synthase subunit PurL [Armatimonadota bacterium]MDR7551031.1 phosphoribosylformylglycinamidine synthase subunit PurL [Armatimonadota bacterium]
MTRPGTADPVAGSGLSEPDYRELCRRLGREPNPIEARMVGVMWSEHCGYKHSKRALRRLPASSPRVLGGPGEHAGVVAITADWAIAFKMESHNHPSAVDPYHGAATGVGGIIRDVLAMGARPIALLDSLRFGPLAEARTRRLCGGVIAGIAGYGNAIGVPTVGGELRTDPCYRDTPLVNVACLGLVRVGAVAHARASGPGNAVLYVGARTGRDGIGGASFASADLDEDREAEDRASVQMGDPFTGKLLIEATLEALAEGTVVAVQDMGAAGLTCAASEMAARGGVGMTLDLDRVPLREPRMRPEEILLSESQERMLLVVPQAAVDRVTAVYRKWGLVAEAIGTVTASPRLHVLAGGRTVADLPPEVLADAPAYEPAAQAPDDLEARWRLQPGSVPATDPAGALLALLGDPDVASKRAVFEQYDHMVGIRTVMPPGADAAVLRLLEAPPLGLALTADGNGRWCAADPRRGAALSVLEAASNLACVGARPLAVTDCLNFGNPERPQVFWAFCEAIDGIAEACLALDVPVIGGNVSFYNGAEGRGDGGAISPTPVIGMVGLVDDVGRLPPPGFRDDGDLVVLLGGSRAGLGASLYVRHVSGRSLGRPADPALRESVPAIRCAADAVRAGLVVSMHDCSDGGLLVALAEACVLGGRGASVALPRDPDVWFGEAPARFVASVPPNRLEALEMLARRHGVPWAVIGRVGGEALRVSPSGDAGTPVEVAVETLAAAWSGLEV